MVLASSSGAKAHLHYSLWVRVNLPYGAAEGPYSAFRVVQPFDVQAGPAAPWFGQIGSGTQYELPASVQSLLKSGHLERINP